MEAVAAKDNEAVEAAISCSVEASLRALRVEVIDILQIHNTCPQILERGEILDYLESLKKQGKCRHLGVSTYGEETPLRAIETGRFQTIQVPFNMLDQSMRMRVFGPAAERKSGVLVRSAFLRGVLTPQVDSLPEKLAPLRDTAHQALDVIGAEAANLAEAALRYCLSFGEVATVIMGVRSAAEAEANIAAAAKGPLRQSTVLRLNRFAVEDERLVNASHWEDFI